MTVLPRGDTAHPGDTPGPDGPIPPAPPAGGRAGRPLPVPTALTEGFWAAAREHRLVVQRCDDCGRLRHYPQERCPECTSSAWSWTPVSGRGVVYTFTRSHQPFHPAWAGRTPYVVTTVELEEGVRMVSDLPPEDTDRVQIGSPVEVFFDDQPDTDVTLPRFRLT